uniref:non-specific serine/threonine protein kinase n=1 Tax=Dermatophagoides pteronyssinus TaxID=6956 RepID=A0A6P6Y792_DERPT|nr:EH domain-containing protein 1-like [Dermatophagoides pteronyssinus]
MGSEYYANITATLSDLYKRKAKPIEEDSAFAEFATPALTEGDFKGNPIIFLLGQYSTGKTTFVKNLLNVDYAGFRIGPEPTTENFLVINCEHGANKGVTLGQAAVLDPAKPWNQLAQFGEGFLSRFQMVTVASPHFRNLTLIDTPGILSNMSSAQRGYDYEGVARYLAQKADLILFFFDGFKLDLNAEVCACLNALKRFEGKLRVVLNKADAVSSVQLVKVLATLMWNLGKVIHTPELPKIYVGSFWNVPYKPHPLVELFSTDSCLLYHEIVSLGNASITRKLDDLVRRFNAAHAHALVLAHIRMQTPTRATLDGVLDPRTLAILQRLQSRAQFTHVNSVVSTGKEANVYVAAGCVGSAEQRAARLSAVKVFKTSILTFRNRAQYVEGERRFRQGFAKCANPRRMVNQWAEKEFRNLRRLVDEGVRVPAPFALKSHVLHMAFLGEDFHAPAPRLKNFAAATRGEWLRLYVEVAATMRQLFQRAKLVHGDLSEYNLLVFRGHPYVIDVSQSIDTANPRALAFLERDCVNVTRFFARKSEFGSTAA